MKKMLVGAGIAAVAAVFVLGGPAPAQATMEISKAAKAAGVEIKNCQHCHVAAMPKKGASDVNDVGKWLLEQKAAKKAEKIDGAWLKDKK